jgi:hypothetical protein
VVDISAYPFGQKVKLAMGAGSGGGVSGTTVGRSANFGDEPGAFRSPPEARFSVATAVRLDRAAGLAVSAPRLGLLLGDFPPAFARSFRNGLAFAIDLPRYWLRGPAVNCSAGPGQPRLEFRPCRTYACASNGVGGAR